MNFTFELCKHSRISRLLLNASRNTGEIINIVCDVIDVGFTPEIQRHTTDVRREGGGGR